MRGSSPLALYRSRFGALALAFVVIAGLLIAGVQLASAAPAGKWHLVSISGYQQQRSTWCGPAAGQTLLSAFGVSVRQSALAKEMDAGDTFGTWPWDMDGPINAQLKKNGQQTRYSYRAGAGTWELYRWAKKGVDQNAPSIILVKSQNIWYPGASFGTGHYLVIYGYNDNLVVNVRKADGTSQRKSYGKVYKVYDPWDGGFHTLAAKDWGTDGKNVGYPGGKVIVPSNV
ncbi:C39 family peptidase [Micromonospora sp. DR5-3]|uniref:C39 family peptidase n=1 Tax=unclassified Micromonospora TaxID=2617518 RepID=UPI0011D7C0E0|nr:MULTISPECIES: C39 family peptidase [unclassified Micromonospora]MCW3816460.1 C39 family peptidase [Micromonospora sp. DR5-3]TYC21248.1 hypothetical protein FXF52_27045 [Micromonospora sp. MP36]